MNFFIFMGVIMPYELKDNTDALHSRFGDKQWSGG
jgi:hypothetical protein